VVTATIPAADVRMGDIIETTDISGQVIRVRFSHRPLRCVLVTVSIESKGVTRIFGFEDPVVVVLED
jgi:hypothetical protein